MKTTYVCFATSVVVSACCSILESEMESKKIILWQAQAMFLFSWASVFWCLSALPMGGGWWSVMDKIGLWR